MYFQVNLIQKFFVIQYQIFYPKDVYIYIYFDEYRFLKKFCPKIRKIQLKKRAELVKNS